MKEKVKVLSLFSSGGVAEVYFEDLGIEISLANEIDEKRAKFYSHLYPKAQMIIGDITNHILRKRLINIAKKNKINCILATPPCQGMSIAGSLDPLDKRNKLITYAIDVIKKLKPKYIMLENVPMQLVTKIKYKSKIINIPEYIKSELQNLYNFNTENMIKTMDYGIPQMRKRNIFLLVRKDLGFTWNFPKLNKRIVSLKEALKNIPSLDPSLREGYEETLKMFPDFEKKKEKGLKISKYHYPPTHAKRHVIWMQKTPPGKTAFDNKYFYPQKSNAERIRGHYNHYRRHAWDKPSRSITQNNGVISSLACVHPGYCVVDGDEKNRIYTDPRCFSIYELLIISSLPLNWNIPTWANENFIRKIIGEGIPPLLVKYIFQELLSNLQIMQNKLVS
jgi:DNA (cytosine-5)-methyltransferase 1